jgi:hypothetical protein
VRISRQQLSGGWAPGISDEQCDELKEDCATFARDMVDATLKDLELLPQEELDAPEVPGPPNYTCHKLFCCNNLNKLQGYRVAKALILCYPSTTFERSRTTAATQSQT